MTEFKAKVVLAPEVHKIISHLTNTLDTEIGAVGKVKIRQKGKEKYFYVYKLLFPQQNVSGASVFFTPAMWGSLVKKYTLKELGDVACYWHRHPGSSAHSDTDEEKTFDAFMDRDANRPFFIFYQTAIGADNNWNDEARIDIRKPIRATILDTDINVEFEDPDEKEIEIICDQIIKDSILEDPNKLEWEDNYSPCKSGYSGNYTPPKTEITNLETGYSVEDKDRVKITFENGQVTILTGPSFKEVLVNALKKTGKLNKIVRRWQITNGKDYKKVNLQPKAKSYLLLKETLAGIFEVYEAFLDAKEEEEGDDDFSDNINVVNDPHLVSTILKELNDGCKIEWSEDNTDGTVYDSKLEVVIGQVVRDKENIDVTFLGETLVSLIKTTEKFQNEKAISKLFEDQKDIRNMRTDYLPDDVTI